MAPTTIQLAEETKKKLDNYKRHPRESYDEVIKRFIDQESFPTMDEMFREADKRKLGKGLSTADIIRLAHEMRD